ncbi:MAG: PD-(D/E)XK nuclease family protein, partial [Bacillota bacterium]
DPALFHQHRQVWRAVMNLLDQLVEVLGDVPLQLAEVAAVLDVGLAALRYSLIPPGLDQVIVGDMERSRLPRGIRALFLCGLNEGCLPAAAKSQGILNAAERDKLAAIWPDRLTATSVSMQYEQFLLYRLLAESAGQLWFCYPLGDAEGKSRLPAQPLRRLRELLPVREEVVLPEVVPARPPWEQNEHPGRLLSGLTACWQTARRGGYVHPGWWQVYNVMLQSPEWRSRLSSLRQGLWEVNQEKPLGGQLAARLWLKKQGGRTVLYSSSSRLERFASCPFAHFLSYGLGLVERQQHKLAPPDTGRLYHTVLQDFVQYVQNHGLDWAQVDDALIQTVCGQLLEKHGRRLQNAILFSNARQRAVLRRLQTNLERALRALVRQMRHSAFRPAACEVRFGTGGATPVPHLEVPLSGGALLALTGQIDRLDLASGPGGELYYRVVDYKTGPSSLALPELLAGTQLQLLVYLSAARQVLTAGAGGVPLTAGAFYMPVHSAPLKLDEPLPPDRLALEQLKQFRLQGLVVNHGARFWPLLDSQLRAGVVSVLVPVCLTREGDVHKNYLASIFTREELAVLQNSLQQLLQRLGQDILAGRVDIAPLKVGGRSACDYCLYYPVCRFDLWLPENSYRLLGARNKQLREQVSGLAGRKGEETIVLYRLDR